MYVYFVILIIADGTIQIYNQNTRKNRTILGRPKQRLEDNIKRHLRRHRVFSVG